MALDKLLNLEKQQRLAEDVTGTKLCCTAILDILYQAKEWKLLNEHILLLAKRRSQLKQVWKCSRASCPHEAQLHGCGSTPGRAACCYADFPFSCAPRIALCLICTWLRRP